MQQLRLKMMAAELLAVSWLEKNSGEAENLPVLRLKVAKMKVLAVTRLESIHETRVGNIKKGNVYG